MGPSRVLLIGDHEHRDFHEPACWLAQHAHLTLAVDVEAALRQLGRHDQPCDAIVIAQSRPGQFSSGQIERLHAAAPLSRLVALLGSWCEGESRTGRPWPGVVRVYWHQWLPRCAKDLMREISGGRSVWDLPRTATDTEQFLHMFNGPLPPRRGLIAIHANHLVTYNSLADACRTAGFSATWVAPGQPLHVQGAAAVIWDGKSCDAREAEQLQQLSAAMKPAPLVAMLDFPRQEDRERAFSSGAAAVVSKPFLLHDLVWQLDRISNGDQRRRDVASAA